MNRNIAADGGMGNCIRSKVTRYKNGTKVQFDLPADAGSEHANMETRRNFFRSLRDSAQQQLKKRGKELRLWMQPFSWIFLVPVPESQVSKSRTEIRGR